MIASSLLKYNKKYAKTRRKNKKRSLKKDRTKKWLKIAKYINNKNMTKNKGNTEKRNYLY